jgi:hypothetical protein
MTAVFAVGQAFCAEYLNSRASRVAWKDMETLNKSGENTY